MYRILSLAVVAAAITLGAVPSVSAKDNAGGGGGGGCYGCQEALLSSWCSIYGQGPGTLFGMTKCETFYNLWNDSTTCLRSGSLCLAESPFPSSPGYL
jgi:hypothetical protein